MGNTCHAAGRRGVTPAGFSFDTGALIALERGDENMRSLLGKALDARWPIHVVPGVLAQAWRDGSRQAVLARFLNLPEVSFPVMDAATARAVGVICGRSGHHDVVDVHVVLDARINGLRVITSDPEDLRRVDPELDIVVL